jgi:hypothetical protein
VTEKDQQCRDDDTSLRVSIDRVAAEIDDHVEPEEPAAPSLRAVTELKLEEDAGAVAFPRWRVHDRTHLELALEYRPEPNARADRFEWEAYFFVPESFRLDQRSYSKDEFWSDFRSYLRLAAPHTSFGELTGEPLERLERALESGDANLAGRELRLFACRVRRAGIDAHGGVLEEMAKNPARAAVLAEAMARDAGRVVDAMRETFRCQTGAKPSERVDAIIRWVDEDVSLVIETLLADVAQHLPEQPEGEASVPLRGLPTEGETRRSPLRGVPDALAAVPERAKRAVLSRAIAEARYRSDSGYEAVMDSGDRARAAERMEFRRHTLKRFTSSVLWLSTEVHAPGRWVLHGLYGLAAGLAMAFAVAAALYNGPTANQGQLSLWLAVAVVAYAIKDRMKAALQEVFAGYVSQHYPDRRWRLFDRERHMGIGLVDEQSGFAEFARLPGDVLDARRLTREHDIEEEARPETVLWHKKAVTLSTEGLHKADERFDALVEIFRLDLSRWLRHTDDHKARLVFADAAAGKVESIVAPRVYNIGVVYRWRRPDQASPWHRIRVVVSRKGIRRIDPIC